MFYLPAILQTLIWIPTRIFFFLVIRLKITGWEKAEEESPPVIFAANHRSQLDPIFIRACLPMFSRHQGIFYVSLSKENYRHHKFGRFFYGGLFFKLWGAYPVYKGLGNYHLAFMHHIKILKSGRSVVIFPEGRVTKNNEPGVARSGIVHLAQITGAKIIPVRLDGTFSLSIKNFLFKHKPVRVSFGDPLSLSELTKNLKLESDNEESHCLIAGNILNKIMVLPGLNQPVAKPSK